MKDSVQNSDSKRVQVLVMGMLDSVHLARWLNQFIQEDIDFIIASSKKYRKIHPLMQSLIRSKHKARYQLGSTPKVVLLAGYIDFLKIYLDKIYRLKNHRVRIIEKVLRSREIDYIHAFEIQGAGYLLSEIHPTLLSQPKVIVTNWGSDIFYYDRFPEHSEKIRKVLALADLYSAECFRDYELATKLGFSGINLPCIPNGGGFAIGTRDENFVPPSNRSQILIKGYGGIFGRAKMVIELIPTIASLFPQARFYIYAVTDDILLEIRKLPSNLKSRISVSTLRNKLSHKEILHQFAQSRIYVGCSESDGISTSFIESLIHGAYPIQTDTSCANEWIQRGARGSIVALDSSTLLDEICRALSEDNLVNTVSATNFEIAKEFLSEEVVKTFALQFYN
jgi:glycosyltransferase involved in cell wall biosynthesis